MRARLRTRALQTFVGVVAVAAGGGAAVVLASAGDGTATTVGDASEHVVSSAYGNTLVIQATDHTGLRSYGVPAGGGVLTSWSLHLSKSDVAGDVKLETLTPQGSNTYVISGQGTGHVEIGTDRTVTFASRIPVRGGERLAVQTPNGMIYAGTVNGGDGDIRAVSGAPAMGATVASTAYQPGGHLAVQAVVEPDADRDGYGDLTQDDCVADAARQAGPCGADLHLTLTASPADIPIRDSTVLTAGVTASGGPVSQPVVTVSLPAGLQLLSAGGTGGDCTGTTTLTCALGDLPRGGQGRVVIGVRGIAAGVQTASASVSAVSPDPAPADNAAAVGVTVAAPPAPAADTTPPSVSLIPVSCPKALTKARCARRRSERARYRTLRLAASDGAGSGVAGVQVAVARKAGRQLDVLTGGSFKRSSATAFASAWLKAKATGKTWTLALPKLAVGVYLVRARATDKAGNVSPVLTRTLRLR